MVFANFVNKVVQGAGSNGEAEQGLVLRTRESSLFQTAAERFGHLFCYRQKLVCCHTLEGDYFKLPGILAQSRVSFALGHGAAAVRPTPPLPQQQARSV